MAGLDKIIERITQDSAVKCEGILKEAAAQATGLKADAAAASKKDADAVLLIGTKTDRQVLQQLKNCKVLVRYGVGYEVVDVPACTEAGIIFCNVPDAGTYEVGSHAFVLALDCLRKVSFYNTRIRKGSWKGGEGYTLRRLNAYTFGYCGFGHIGQAAAGFAQSLGCRRIAYDPFTPDEVFERMGVERVSFEQLLEQSDMISVHTPLMPSTWHMFSHEQFAKMKPGSVIVNTSRGGVIDQEALLDAIDLGYISAAGLDVNEREPLKDLSDRTFQYDTVILTPHSATESVEYFANLQEKVARTAIIALQGKLPPNIINREVLEKLQMSENT